MKRISEMKYKRLFEMFCNMYSSGKINFQKLISKLGRLNRLFLSIALLMMITCSAFADSGVIVKNAQKEIGRGELFFDNCGPDVKRYLNGQEHLPWCAGFVSYVLRESAVKIKYTLRARDFLKLGKIIKSPRAGDLIVFSRGRNLGHVGIIEKVSKDTITTIEGNTGNIPSKVKRIIYHRNKIKNFLAFVRI